MRSLHVVALSLATLIPAFASAGVRRLVHQDENAPNVITAMSQAGLKTEPVLLPSLSAPMLTAKATLEEAHALVASHANGIALPTLGFKAERLDLGKPDYRNEIALWKPREDGTFIHIGYALEMRVDGKDGSPWVPIVLGRRGNLKNRLFLGHDSVFSMGAKHVPTELLEKIGAADIEGRIRSTTSRRWSSTASRRWPTRSASRRSTARRSRS